MAITGEKVETTDLHVKKRKRDSKATMYLWAASHATIVVLSVYMLGNSFLLRKRLMHNRIIYRLAFMLIASNYTFSILKFLDGEQVRTAALVAMDSTQYLCLALLWIIMPTHSSKLVPFAVISLLHCIDFVSTSTAKELSKPLSMVIGYANLFVLFKCLTDAVLIRHGGAISLLVYAFFYRFRVQFSPIDNYCARTLWRGLDTQLSSDRTPAQVRGYWGRIRNKILSYESQAEKEARIQNDKRAIKEANIHNTIN